MRPFRYYFIIPPKAIIHKNFHLLALNMIFLLTLFNVQFKL